MSAHEARCGLSHIDGAMCVMSRTLRSHLQASATESTHALACVIARHCAFDTLDTLDQPADYSEPADGLLTITKL